MFFCAGHWTIDLACLAAEGDDHEGGTWIEELYDLGRSCTCRAEFSPDIEFEVSMTIASASGAAGVCIASPEHLKIKSGAAYFCPFQGMDYSGNLS